jgi:hypothetical protein
VITLFDILPQAEGAQLIRDCWGEVPQFNHIQIFHLKHTVSQGVADVLVLADFASFEGGVVSKDCKPSKIVIQFSDVSHFEFIDAFGDHPAHGVRLDAVFTSEPPSGVLAIDTRDGFHIACRQVRVLKCIHEPLTDISEEVDAT